MSQTYRRPYAVACLPLAELLNGPETGSLLAQEREFTLKLYQGDEKDYGLWQHELVSKRSNSKFSLLSGPSSQGIYYRVKFFPKTDSFLPDSLKRSGHIVETFTRRTRVTTPRTRSAVERNLIDTETGVPRRYHAGRYQVIDCQLFRLTLRNGRVRWIETTFIW